MKGSEPPEQRTNMSSTDCLIPPLELLSSPPGGGQKVETEMDEVERLAAKVARLEEAVARLGRAVSDAENRARQLGWSDLRQSS